MEQTNSTYKLGEAPPVYSSQKDCVVQQPTVPPSHQQVNFQNQQFTSPIISQKRPAYKTSVRACNLVSCLVTCFCYPFVWAKIAGRVNLCCGRRSRGIWMGIMCLIVYGCYYVLPIFSLITAPSDLDTRNGRSEYLEYNTEDQAGLFAFLMVLVVFSSLQICCVCIPCNLPIPILTCLLSGRVRQEKQIERNECNDCCSAFCCNCCLVHQMAVETMDETPNCSNIWVA